MVPLDAPIDISVIAIPRRLVPSTRFATSIAFTKCVTIPSRPPVTTQPSTMLISLSNA